MQQNSLKEVDPRTLREWVDRGEAVVIDVREPDEHARERIPAATLAPLSSLDPASLPESNGQRLVLHCRGGKRSAEACARLLAAGRGEVYSLAGGIEAWKAAGLEVRTNAALPIAIMRQVQLTVGGAVLGGSLLAWLVSPWFLLLTGFFGAGLLVAGATGTCMLAAALGAMPWNRGFKGSSCGAGGCGAGGKSDGV